MRTVTMEEEQAERSVRARWQGDQRLRAEFGDNLDAAVAYAKAEARGQVRIHRSHGVVSGASLRRTPSASFSAPGESAPHATASAGHTEAAIAATRAYLQAEERAKGTRGTVAPAPRRSLGRPEYISRGHTTGERD